MNPFTDDQIKFLAKEIEHQNNAEKMEDKEILWHLMNSDFWNVSEIVGFMGAIFSELENRLYPEYDGESVTFENYGWNTPEGRIEY